jgi:hypothetical protein
MNLQFLGSIDRVPEGHYATCPAREMPRSLVELGRMLRFLGVETMPAGNDARARGVDLKSLREFAERYAAAWCSHNAASVAAHYSPRGTRGAVLGTTPSVGRGAIEVAVQQFMAAFPDLHVTLGDVLIVGDAVDVHWTLTGVNSGPGGTGQRVCIKGFDEWRMGKDALIAEAQVNWDKADFQRQLAKGATASSTPSSSTPR